ncbi:uncharacterized protein LOC126771723 [Nymphalis io]|uniref:uncharacterized protein LOC126771723 n=1 Tax=Inachis io TaxID=171585 RepID=UPI00216881BC|nr:uncharacterized protein LOC126771723 [Nymphalis io]
MFWLVMLLSAATSCVHAQLTAQTSVAPDLRECYTDVNLINRNNLPPTSMSVLIDIISKIEDNPNVNMDLRQLVVVLLQTYRQDGIEFHQPGANIVSSSVLPFSPTFHSFYRNKLLLTKIIPGNLQVLSNNTINSALKCALHNMISTTIDARIRGNENTCNTLAQYRALRTIRDNSHHAMKDDVEILDLSSLNSAGKNGQMRQFNPKDDIEYTDLNGIKSERQLLGESQCPILGGVVSTPSGAVSAGNVLAGIAAGAQFQTIPILELAKGSIINDPNIQQFVTSTYPATLSGDLAEAVLIQNIERGSTSISIGAAGNWNSTQAQRYFMLSSRNNIEMSDPEIRGGIDGFILGSLVNSALQGSSLKLSQLLDMYYSARNGVFDPTRRACNRRNLSQQLIQNTNLIAETYAFAAALDTNIPLRGTIIGRLEEPVNSAVTNFQSYVSNNLNDLSCFSTDISSNNYRLKTNLYLVVDSAWQYQTIYPAISFLLDNIEVGKFGSSVTLLSAFDGNVIINKTFSLADFHTEYTLARHQSILTGVNLETALTNIRIMMQSELENERTNNYVGGNSTVILFLLSSSVQNTQLTWEQARILNETVPDLRMLFATATNQYDSLWTLVRDVHNDIRTISLNSDGNNAATAMNLVLGSIEQVGRRIVNPLCGSTYPSESTSGTRQFDDYVEPGSINYYSISPNYFHGANDNRRLRIVRTNAGMGSLVVCYSRFVTQPRQNATSSGQDGNDVICQTLASSGNVEIGLQNPCDGHWTIGSCPFFYLSVWSQVPATTTTFNSICTDNGCRFPYNIRYQVQINDFGCYSGCGRVGLSVVLLIFTYLLNYV